MVEWWGGAVVVLSSQVLGLHDRGVSKASFPGFANVEIGTCLVLAIHTV